MYSLLPQEASDECRMDPAPAQVRNVWRSLGDVLLLKVLLSVLLLLL